MFKVLQDKASMGQFRCCENNGPLNDPLHLASP